MEPKDDREFDLLQDDACGKVWGLPYTPKDDGFRKNN